VLGSLVTCLIAGLIQTARPVHDFI